MITIVMAGGRGSRLGGVVKPLLELCNATLIEHVLNNLLEVSSLVIIALSHYTLRVYDVVKRYPGVETVMTPGKDYVYDLVYVLSTIRYRPLLVMPSDTPFLDSKLVKDFLEKASRVEADIATLLVRDASSNRMEAIGVSLVKGYSWSEKAIVYEWRPQFININTWHDYSIAQRLCRQ